jgi:hypothetical protein
MDLLSQVQRGFDEGAALRWRDNYLECNVAVASRSLKGVKVCHQCCEVAGVMERVFTGVGWVGLQRACRIWWQEVCVAYIRAMKAT